MKTNPIW